MPNRLNEWITFFDHHAPYYMQEAFTRSTTEEVAFLVEELALLPGSRIPDVGCGTGRHAIELARRGFLVTGIDISEGMLREAQKSAGEAGVQIDWVLGYAAAIHLEQELDGAICLCEGAFGLLGSGDDPCTNELAILEGIYSSLKAGAKLILTALNGLRKIRRQRRRWWSGDRLIPWRSSRSSILSTRARLRREASSRGNGVLFHRSCA